MGKEPLNTKYARAMRENPTVSTEAADSCLSRQIEIDPKADIFKVIF